MSLVNKIGYFIKEIFSPRVVKEVVIRKSESVFGYLQLNVIDDMGIEYDTCTYEYYGDDSSYDIAYKKLMSLSSLFIGQEF